MIFNTEKSWKIRDKMPKEPKEKSEHNVSTDSRSWNWMA